MKIMNSMTEKEVHEKLLTRARKCINRRNYKEIITICELILAEDESNYDAKLLLGRAYLEDGQGERCEEILIKAVKSDLNQIPGWLELIRYFERVVGSGPANPGLLLCYRKVSELYKNDKYQENKYLAYQIKLVRALIKKEDFMDAFEVIEILLKKIPMTFEIAKLLIRIFNVKNLTIESGSDLIVMERQALSFIIYDFEFEPTGDQIERYTELLYQSENQRLVLKECLRMKRFFNKHYHPIELLLRVYFESNLQTYSVVDQIEELVTKLKRLHPTTIFGNLALGKYYFSKRDFIKCVYAFNAGLEHEVTFKASQILVKALLKLRDFSKAIDVCKKTMEVEAIHKLENKTFKEVIKCLEIEAKIGIYFQNCLEGKNDDKEKDQKLLLVDIGQLIYDYEDDKLYQDDNFLIQKAKYYLLIQRYLKFDQMLNHINLSRSIKSVYPEIELLNILYGNEDKRGIEASRDSIFSLSKTRNDNFEIQMFAALYLKYLNDSTNASFLLSKIALKWPNHPAAHYYLSLLKTAEFDIKSSIHYMENAFTLYKCKTFGLLLSDMYFEIKDYENYLNVIQTSIEYLKSNDTQWATFRLAVYNLKEGEVEEAIFGFQTLLKKDYNNGLTWELIAEAYCRRGSYISALRAYTKAMELDRNKSYCLYKIGQLQRNILEIEEAIKTLSQITEEYMPALMELSLAYLDLSRDNISKYLINSSISSINCGLRTAFRSIQQQGNDIQGWIMMGEFTLLIKDLPQETIFEVPSIFLKEKVQSYSTKCDSAKIGLIQLLSVGTLCFEKAVKIIQKELFKTKYTITVRSYALYSLSKSYYMRSLFSNDENDKATLLNNSMTYAKSSIITDDNSYIHWNHLGIVAQSQNNFKLAQHAFIKSIKINSNNVATWSNLGILYFLLKKYTLAYDCISRAQQVNPWHSTSWTVQAYLAEHFNSAEAIDLFKHSCQMENPNDLTIIRYIEKIVAYMSDWAWKIRGFTYHVNLDDGYISCLDLITKYTSRHPKDIEALNYQGILAGLEGFKQTSENSFRKCLEVCEAMNFDENYFKKLSISEAIMLNLAISMQQKEEFTQALEIISKVKIRRFKLCTTEAMIHRKLGNYQESYKVYEEMLSWPVCPSDYKQVIYTMIGMSLVLQKLHGFDQAKDKLIECFETDPHMIEPLLILCSLSITNNCIDLVNFTLKELINFEDEPEQLSDIAFLRACGACVKNEIRKSKDSLIRILHMWPRNAEIWSDLANHIVRYMKITKDKRRDDARNVRNCIENSIQLTKKDGVTLTKKDVSEDMPLIALSALMDLNWDEAIHLSQKAIRLFPFVSKNWVILVAAIYNKSKATNDLQGFEKALKIAESTLTKFDFTDDKSGMLDWLTQFKKHVEILLSSRSICHRQ